MQTTVDFQSPGEIIMNRTDNFIKKIINCRHLFNYFELRELL